MDSRWPPIKVCRKVTSLPPNLGVPPLNMEWGRPLTSGGVGILGSGVSLVGGVLTSWRRVALEGDGLGGKWWSWRGVSLDIIRLCNLETT